MRASGRPKACGRAEHVAVGVVARRRDHAQRVSLAGDAVVRVVLEGEDAFVRRAERLAAREHVAVGVELQARLHAQRIRRLDVAVGGVEGIQRGARVRRAGGLRHGGAVATGVVGVVGGDAERARLACEAVVGVVDEARAAPGVAGGRKRPAAVGRRDHLLVVLRSAVEIAYRVVDVLGEIALGGKRRDLAVHAVEVAAAHFEEGRAEIQRLARLRAVTHRVVGELGGEAFAVGALGQAIEPVVGEADGLVLRIGRRRRPHGGSRGSVSARANSVWLVTLPFAS